MKSARKMMYLVGMFFYNTIQVALVSLLFLSGCKQKEANTPSRAETSIAQAQPTASKVDTMKEANPTIKMDYVLGRFDPTDDDRFSKIDIKYADRQGLYMRTEAYEDFQKMHAAALKDGVKLIIRSAARNFSYQRMIWEKKWSGKTLLENKMNAAKDLPDPKARALQIMNYSAMPGASRHHWGTDIDLNSFSNEYFESGKGKKIYDWLTAHAADYGYYLPYTSKASGRTGYNEERWHWTYKPISLPLTKYSLKHLKNEDLVDFSGSETAVDIDVVKKYVGGIAEDCLK